MACFSEMLPVKGKGIIGATIYKNLTHVQVILLKFATEMPKPVSKISKKDLPLT